MRGQIQVIQTFTPIKETGTQVISRKLLYTHGKEHALAEPDQYGGNHVVTKKKKHPHMQMLLIGFREAPPGFFQTIMMD